MRKVAIPWRTSAFKLAYLWQASAYTIHSLEWVQRDPEKSLLGSFTERQEETIRTLLLTSAIVPHDMHPSVNINHTFIIVHATLFRVFNS